MSGPAFRQQLDNFGKCWIVARKWTLNHVLVFEPTSIVPASITIDDIKCECATDSIKGIADANLDDYFRIIDRSLTVGCTIPNSCRLNKVITLRCEYPSSIIAHSNRRETGKASTPDLSAQDGAKVTIGFLQSHKKYSSRNSGWKEPVR